MNSKKIISYLFIAFFVVFIIAYNISKVIVSSNSGNKGNIDNVSENIEEKVTDTLEQEEIKLPGVYSSEIYENITHSYGIEIVNLQCLTEYFECKGTELADLHNTINFYYRPYLKSDVNMYIDESKITVDGNILEFYLKLNGFDETEKVRMDISTTNIWINENLAVI